MFEFTSQDWEVLTPVLVLALGAVIVLLADLFGPRGELKRTLVHIVALIASVVAIVFTIYLYSPATNKASEVVEKLGPSMRQVWSFRMETIVASLVLQAISLLVLIASSSWLTDEDDPHHGEYHALLMFFPIGGIVMVSAKHLMLAFIGLELLSVTLYILVAIRRSRYESVEAGLKYFLLGAFAAAIFLYGTALIYAGNGPLNLLEIGDIDSGSARPMGLAALGGGLLFIALFFKCSVAPFHMWTPDVYQGAPTPITALMSTGTKAAAFLLLAAAVAPLIPQQLEFAVPILTVVTIVVGNFGALVQTDLKRLIAYSGVAHAGYLMIAISAQVLGRGPQDAASSIRALIFYLAAYAITNLTALFVIALLEKDEPGIAKLENIKGLARRNPVSATVLALAMISLAGIPPTIGFWGKYQIFAAALQAKLPVLAIVGILFSVVGLYYYLKVVVYAFFHEGTTEDPIRTVGIGGKLATAVCALAILVLGLLPGLLLDKLVHIVL